jgi:hypothetical protein
VCARRLLNFAKTIGFSTLAIGLAGAADVCSGVEKHTSIPTAASVAASRTSFIGMAISLACPPSVNKGPGSRGQRTAKKGNFSIYALKMTEIIFL